MFCPIYAFEPAKRGREALDSLNRVIVANEEPIAPCNGLGQYIMVSLITQKKVSEIGE